MQMNLNIIINPESSCKSSITNLKPIKPFILSGLNSNNGNYNNSNYMETFIDTETSIRSVPNQNLLNLKLQESDGGRQITFSDLT